MTTCASSLHTFLKAHNKRPSRKLSQNFLIDQNIVQKMISCADIQPADVVLEIGPGTGAITSQLIQSAKHVFAVEKDFQLAEALSKVFAHKNCTIIQGDCVDIDYSSIDFENQRVKVVSNLPFQVTSLVFEKLLRLNKQFSQLTVILQKDVLDRILAPHGTKNYSSLTLFTQLFAEVTHCFNVPSSCYFPRPNVETSVANFKLKESIYPKADALLEIVHLCFRQRRKMLSSTVPLPAQHVQKILESLNMNPYARPEDLSLAQWIAFYEALETDLRA